MSERLRASTPTRRRLFKARLDARMYERVKVLACVRGEDVRDVLEAALDPYLKSHEPELVGGIAEESTVIPIRTKTSTAGRLVFKVRLNVHLYAQAKGIACVRDVYVHDVLEDALTGYLDEHWTEVLVSVTEASGATVGSGQAQAGAR